MPSTTLLNHLQSLRRRVKGWSVVYGAGVVVAAGVGALLGTVLLDYLLDLAAVPRLGLALLAAGVVGYCLFRFVVRPVLARLTLGDVAGRLEQAFPQFDDRLRSTVNFARGEVPGSAAMQQRVASEAAELATKLDLDRVIVLKPVWQSLAAGAGAVLLLVLITLLSGSQYRQIALSRLIDPFGGNRWPKSVQIALVGDVPRRVPVGQKVDVKMRLARGDRSSRKAIIYYQYAGGPLQQEYMTRNEDGTYSASLDARTDLGGAASRELRVRVAAGDDQVALTPINVVPRLAITRVEAAVTAPPYAQQPPRSVNLAQAPAVLVAGADVLVNVEFNKPLDLNQPVRIEPVNPETQPPQTQWGRSSDSLVTARWTANESLRFHIRATDTDGFQNAAMEEYELIVRPDQMPTVQIENPRRNEERTAVALVPLQAVADDDLGIRSAKLIVERLAPGGSTGAAATRPGGAGNHWEIDLVSDGAAVAPAVWSKIDGTAAERQRYRLNYAWELSQLPQADLKPGDVLEYHLQVQDSFELNGQTHPPVASGRLRITIISQEELSARLGEDMRFLAQQVGEVLKTQTRVKEETGSLAEDTKDKVAFDAADRAVAERLANQQGNAASQARQIASKLEGLLNRMTENRSPNEDLKSIASDVRTQLNQTSENPMKDAGAHLSQANQPRQPVDVRNKALEDAGASQEQAVEQLQTALDRMGNIGTLQQTIDRIRDLLARQQQISAETAAVGKANLGKKPEQMSAEDRAKLEQAAKEQEALAGETDKALAGMQKLAEQLAKSDPASAEAMKQAADTGQKQQVSSNQFKAARQARENQQTSAQSAQKQAELGLQMMLGELRNAEKRKLEELARQLEQVQQQIANLIRRQAGHNLDDLTLQGAAVLAKLDPRLLQDLREKAHRDAATADDEQSKPQLPQLSLSQEQTERNTRDIAKMLESMTSGAESAAHLTRAAGRMERAAVLLRESKLAEAYEPPLVQALAALEEAKRRIDQKKAEVEQQKQEQEKEAVRQAYIAIRKEQEKLNQETTRIDGSPRLAGGVLKREEAIRLGQLPTEQGKLAERTDKLGEDLAAVHSTVYVWANADIVRSMREVKDDLGQSRTGKPTQAEQARILEQLDAMIRNLEIKPPPEPKFAQRESGGGGGGGGGGAPRLPPEVELRLLKDLQLAVNRSTRTIDAQPAPKDKPKLQSLGERQGELRKLLGELLEQSSRGQVKLGPEPDNRDQLPEEASAEQIEDQELEQELLSGEPTAEKIEKDVGRIGDRMARSRQRLALNHDPGKTTQAIQERIARNMDDLIDMARQQQQQAQPQSSQGQGQAKQQPRRGTPGNPNPGQAQTGQPAQARAAQNPAQNSTLRPGQTPNADLSQDIRQTAREWGGLSQRQRQAVIEGAGETTIEKYKRLVDDYYRSLATKATERQ